MEKIVLLLCCYLSVSCTLAQTTDCGITWQPSVRLAIGAGRPSLVTQTDTIHLVYFGGQKRLPYARSTNGGSEWEATRDLIIDTTMFPFEVTNSFLATNSSMLFLFFNGGINGSGKSPIFMMQSSDRGGIWAVPHAINPDFAPIRNVSVQGDTIAILALVEAIDSEVVFRSTDAGETWGSTSVPFYSNDPRIALSQGWLHLAYAYYQEGCSIEQWYRRSSDLGITWGDSILLSNCDNRAGGTPSIAATEDGNVYISWTDSRYGCMGIIGCNILFRRSTDYGSTWGEEQIFTEVPWGDVSKVSSLGTYVLATWAGGTRAELRLSIDRGTTWSPICTVVDTGGYPTNGLSPNSAFVTWGRNDSSRIFVRSGGLPSVYVNDPSIFPANQFTLYGSFPNPFNGSTTIKYLLANEASVKIEIFNALGQSISLIQEGRQTIGEHYVQWDAKDYPSGVYLYRIIAGTKSFKGKVLLIR